MLLSWLPLGLLLVSVVLQALTFYNLHALRSWLPEQVDALLSTITTTHDEQDLQLPLGYHTHPEPATTPHVLDARDLTDEELFAELRRRNGGEHETETEEQP